MSSRRGSTSSVSSSVSRAVVEHHDVLAVEKEFRLQAGAFEVLGFIDRVDRVDDETVAARA